MNRETISYFKEASSPLFIPVLSLMAFRQPEIKIKRDRHLLLHFRSDNALVEQTYLSALLDLTVA